jgi:hypothetical protein
MSIGNKNATLIPITVHPSSSMLSRVRDDLKIVGAVIGALFLCESARLSVKSNSTHGFGRHQLASRVFAVPT